MAGPEPNTQVDKMSEEKSTNYYHPPWLYVVTIDFINLVMSSAEIALVLYLTIHHIREERSVIAIAMLAPILLNFVGVTYFFSDPTERYEFEKVGQNRLTKDLFQVPVFGPVFTAFKVLWISTGLTRSKSVDYARFEACAVKMRQCQTFFSAAPEAVVQLSILLISVHPHFTMNHALEILLVVVSLFTLAEANVYALRSNYFHLFHPYEEGDWAVEEESFWKKCILFLHSFSSIASRITAFACLIAGIQTVSLSISGHAWSSREMIHPFARDSLGERKNSTRHLAAVIALTYLALLVYNMIVYYISRFSRYVLMEMEIPGGCYESINYSWRSTILHTGFQSKNIATQIWFYVENCIMFGVWWVTIYYLGDVRIQEHVQNPMTIGFGVATLVSLGSVGIAMLIGLHKLEGPFSKKDRMDSNAQVISVS